ncbi:hypothetical protein V8J88_19515 [Massilia sp. W12]|uniref:hypothetical protein n=1 Tax=Massilia sp. W12 TaxID=3126507 RepID=UPI0030D45016
MTGKCRWKKAGAANPGFGERREPGRQNYLAGAQPVFAVDGEQLAFWVAGAQPVLPAAFFGAQAFLGVHAAFFGAQAFFAAAQLVLAAQPVLAAQLAGDLAAQLAGEDATAGVTVTAAAATTDAPTTFFRVLEREDFIIKLLLNGKRL